MLQSCMLLKKDKIKKKEGDKKITFCFIGIRKECIKERIRGNSLSKGRFK